MRRSNLNPVQTKITTGVFEITPEAAKLALESSLGNRSPKFRNIDSFVRQMEDGGWQLNGESIIFDSNGNVRDGHNRLRSCVMAGKPFQSVVVFGVAPEAFGFIDEGANRSHSEVLQMNGEVNCSILATTILRLIDFEDGRVNNPASVKITHREMLDYLKSHPSVRESINLPFNPSVISKSRIAWIHFLCSQTRPQAATEFFTRLATGDSLMADSPVFVLRARLVADKCSKSKLSMVELTALIFKAWNAFVSRKKISSLRWRRDGDAPEAFPKLLL